MGTGDRVVEGHMEVRYRTRMGVPSVLERIRTDKLCRSAEKIPFIMWGKMARFYACFYADHFKFAGPCYVLSLRKSLHA